MDARTYQAEYADLTPSDRDSDELYEDHGENGEEG